LSPSRFAVKNAFLQGRNYHFWGGQKAQVRAQSTMYRTTINI